MSAKRMELVTIGDEQKLVFSHGPDMFHYTDPEFGDWMNTDSTVSYAEIILKSIVSSVYDFQKLRVMVGQRIFALYNQMLGNEPGTPIYSRISPGDITKPIAEAAGMQSMIANENDLDDEEVSTKLQKERQKKIVLASRSWIAFVQNIKELLIAWLPVVWIHDCWRK